MAYRIEFTPEALRHFEALHARQRGIVRDALLAQLLHQPTRATRNRRRLRPNTLAGYRLRVRNLRVYYDVVDEPDGLVLVQAIGIKVRERVMIAGEEIDLS